MWSREIILFVSFIFLLNLSCRICVGTLTKPATNEVAEKNSKKGSLQKYIPTRVGSKRKPKRLSEFQLTNTIIKEAGYNAEVFTLDVRIGYGITIGEKNAKKSTFELKIFRIRDPKRLGEKGLPVVLLMHGCMGSSSDYVFGGKENGLGFHLVDKGYDVWLGNFRGNVYGGLRQIKEPMFWDFSFHEMARFDLPTQINYILHKTGQRNLSYIGMSMGTTVPFAMLSMYGNYNQKIKNMVSLAPVVYFDSSVATFVESMIMNFHALSDKIGKLSHIRKLSYLRTPLILSKTPIYFKDKCRAKMAKGWMSTIQSNDFNKDLRNKFYKIFPIGTSVKTIAHYLQMVKSGKFRPFSYKKQKNFEVYNSPSLSNYNLGTITVPQLLMIGEKDSFSSEKGIVYLKGNLTGVRNSGAIRVKKVPGFKHLDFYIANKLTKLVFEPVSRYLETGEP